MYQFERTVFGEVSAPSRANYAMRRNVDENGDLPLGVKAVYKRFYMDDGLPSTNSREEAIEMRKQMTELLRRGGFQEVFFTSGLQMIKKSWQPFQNEDCCYRFQSEVRSYCRI